jgi:hypothetical protein
MREQYIWLLKKLKKEKVIKKWMVVNYSGKIPSFNQMWAGMHWKARKRMADSYHLIFRDYLKKIFKGKNEPATAFSIYIFYNSRHDPDNIMAIEKLFVDTLVRDGYVVGDDKKHYKSLVICPDTTLKKNTVEFNIVLHNDKKPASI